MMNLDSSAFINIRHWQGRYLWSLSTDANRACGKHGSLCANQNVDKQTKPNLLTPEELANYKLNFVQEFNVDFIVVPFDQEPPLELVPLTGEHIEVRDGKIFEVI